MVRERIKELVDFATTESPYRDANKGWLNDDVYVQWGAAQELSSKSGVEMANISIFWNPINKLALILFGVLFLASTVVFLAVSLSHGRFQLASQSSEPRLVQPLQQTVELTSPLESNIEASSKVAPAIEKKVELETAKTSSEFAAAALGGQQLQR